MRQTTKIINKQKRKKMKKETLIALFLLCIGGVACTNKSEEKTSQQEATTKVTTCVAQEMEYTPKLSFTGTAEANREVNLASTIPGKVEKMYYRKGDFVPKGSKIATLSEEMLIQAQVEYNTLKKDYERLSRLKEKGSISIMDFDHLEAKYEASRAKVDMLQKNTTIVAPFSGVLVDIMVQEGEHFSFVPSVNSDLKVKSGIVTLMQLNPLKIKIEVNEKQLPLIHKGNGVEVVFDAYPQEKIKGKISAVSPVLSTTSRTTTVELEVPNTHNKFKPGMFCRVMLNLSPTKAVFVPLNAIYRQSGTGNNFVFTLNNDNTVKRVAVTQQDVVGDLVHLPELSAGDVVVVNGKNKLNDNAPVEVVNHK